MQACLNLLFLILYSSMAWSGTLSPWYSKNSEQQLELKVDVFMTSTCPHCHKADAFFKSIEPKMPWLKVNRHVINQDKQALKDFQTKLLEFESTDYSVPAIFFCGVKWVGFESDKTSGERLLQGLNYCYQQIKKEGQLTPITTHVIERMAPNLFQVDSQAKPAVLNRTSVLALLDALNPCALFALMLFFSFLFIQESTGKKVLVGLLMIPCVAVLHYLQQAQFQAYYFLLSGLRWPTAILGLCLIFYALFYKKIGSAILGPVLAFLSMVSVYIYQQSCISNNFSLVYQQWLLELELTDQQLVFYQVLYQFIYICPLILTWIFVIYYLSAKQAAERKTRFEAVGVLYLLAIGMMMLVNPWAMSSFYLSFIVIATLSIAAWVLNGFKR